MKGIAVLTMVFLPATFLAVRTGRGAVVNGRLGHILSNHLTSLPIGILCDTHVRFRGQRSLAGLESIILALLAHNDTTNRRSTANLHPIRIRNEAG